jgi:DNA repair protein RecO (recombination protein O)
LEWRDHGIVLAARRHGERSFVVDILTKDHGRHAGLIRESGKNAARVQPGTDVQAQWRARLSDHMGHWTLESIKVRAAGCLDDPMRLAGLAAATAVTQAFLPERQPHPQIFAALTILLDAILEDTFWPALYVRYELGLLSELGFGLDLSQCALSDVTGDLAYVSPRTGRAVSREAGAPWADKLLNLPGFLTGRAGFDADRGAIMDGLALTGHFLERHMPDLARARIEEVRGRLTQRLQQL